jgi:hypothetical protein
VKHAQVAIASLSGLRLFEPSADAGTRGASQDNRRASPDFKQMSRIIVCKRMILAVSIAPWSGYKEDMLERWPDQQSEVESE